MQFAWLLTAFTATLSCMATGATAAETDAAAEAAALAIAKKLYPTCAVSFGLLIAVAPAPLRSRVNHSASGPLHFSLIFRSGPS